MNENPTVLWCSITNALIEKYKGMTQEDSNKALSELILLRNCLLNEGFLTLKELEN